MFSIVAFNATFSAISRSHTNFGNSFSGGFGRECGDREGGLRLHMLHEHMLRI